MEDLKSEKGSSKATDRKFGSEGADSFKI